MKVTCPNCQTKYNLPDDKIPESGAKVRCTRCKHVFSVDKPAAPETVMAAPAPETPEPPVPPIPSEEPAAGPTAPPTEHDQDIDDLFGDSEPLATEAKAPAPPTEHDKDIDDLFGDSAEVKTEARAPAADEKVDTGTEGIEDLFGEKKAAEKKPMVFETEEKGLGKGGLGLAELGKTLASENDETRRPASPRSKALALALAGIVVLAGLGLGTLYFLKMGPFSAKAPQTAEQQPPAEEKKAEDVFKNLALTGVRQYMVDDAKAGKLFVVEGKVKNNFPTPKEYIKVQATLFDDKGASLATKDVVAGNTVSYFQLQVQSAEELESALNSQVGILTNNLNVRPGGEVPFMIVFYNPPDSLQEFAVKGIDAKDPGTTP